MNFNKVILVGRIGNDAENRYSASGLQITSFNLAVNEYGKDKESKTQWFKIITFDKVANNVSKYCAKGDLVLVDGKISTKEWTDRTGAKQKSFEIIANLVSVLNRATTTGVSETTQTRNHSNYIPPTPPPNKYDPYNDDDDLPF